MNTLNAAGEREGMPRMPLVEQNVPRAIPPGGSRAQRSRGPRGFLIESLSRAVTPLVNLPSRGPT